MAKISSCFKWTFVFFNSLFAIFGVLIIALGLYTQQYAKEVPLKKATDSERKVNFRTGAIALYVIGSLVLCFAVLGAYGAHKESKCELIVRTSINHEYFKKGTILTKDQERALNPIQENFHCCGLFNGSSEWQGEIPDSCNCVNKKKDDMCETVSSRSVWSEPCGPIMMEYIDYVLIIIMAVFFSLAALAILGGLMSFAMIICVCVRS